jgi:hypothetical protein
MSDSESEKRFQELQSQGEAELIRFLTTELDFAFTLLKTVEIDAKTDPPAVSCTHSKAQEALSAVGHFEEGIKEPDSREQIDQRANQLEDALHRIPH